MKTKFIRPLGLIALLLPLNRCVVPQNTAIMSQVSVAEEEEGYKEGGEVGECLHHVELQPVESEEEEDAG